MMLMLMMMSGHGKMKQLNGKEKKESNNTNKM